MLILADVSFSLEDAIDRLVDNTPTVVRTFDPDDATAFSLINDLALQLHSSAIIAARYGLTLPALHHWLKQPEVLRRAKQRRAHFQSDTGIIERNRAMYGLMHLDAATRLDRIIHDPATPPAVLIEALKHTAKTASLDTTPRVDPNVGAGGPAGPQFAINILFSGGEVQHLARVTATPAQTIEGDPAP